MGFDNNFFDELRTLNETVISPITPEAYRPSVRELHTHNRVSTKFLMTTTDFVKKLYQKSKHKYQFSFDFRVYPQHICNFSNKKSFRKQLNVGFSAGNVDIDDSVRIGLGFSINMNINQRGVDEYLDFLRNISRNPKKFDNTFSQLGNYAEPSNIFSPTLNSTMVLNDTPDYNDDWRFYGKLINFKKNRNIFSSVDTFADEVIKVFDHILTSGYY